MSRPTEVIPLHLYDGTWTDGHDLSFCQRRFSRFWGIPDGVCNINMTLSFRPGPGMRRLVPRQDDESFDAWAFIEVESAPGRGDAVRFELYTETFE